MYEEFCAVACWKVTVGGWNWLRIVSLCPVVSFGISSVDPSGSATRELVI